MQTDYNNMIKSIKKYGGFYIGRYETSISDATSDVESVTETNEKVQSKKGVIPVSAKYNSQTWYGLYNKQRNYAKDNGISNVVESSMIWGSQYDAILNWALKGNDKEKVAENSKKHELSPTGSESTDIINNIYDLGNNLREWTLEANANDSRVSRGANYDGSGAPSYRKDDNPDNKNRGNSSRITLIIRD